MWERYNQTTHIFEKSVDNGQTWAPLPLSAAIITEGSIPIPSPLILTGLYPQLILRADTVPLIQWEKTDAPVNQKKWRAYISGDYSFRIDILNDAETAVVNTPLRIKPNANVQIAGPDVLLTLYDTAVAANTGKFRLINSGQYIYIQAIADDDATTSGYIRVDRAGNLVVLGSIQTVSVIYPGRIDVSAAQGSWYLASHASYGLYANAGFCVVGTLWLGNYIFPGQVGAGIQSSWYLASHASYGLYTNTGFYAAGPVWSAANVLSGTTVNAGQGIIEWGRSTKLGEWADLASLISLGDGATFSYISAAKITRIGRTAIFTFHGGINIPSAFSRYFLGWNYGVYARVSYQSAPIGIGTRTGMGLMQDGYGGVFMYWDAYGTAWVPGTYNINIMMSFEFYGS